MKIFLSPSNQDGNPYAWGNTNEAAVCGEIAKKVEAALIRHGFSVKLMHEEDIATKVSAADAWGADLYIPIHTNAFNGEVSGTRMFYYTEGGKGQDLCKAIFKRLAPLTPGTSENIKQAAYAELVQPKAYSCYIEVDFHDVTETAKWLVEHTTEIAEAICQGVCDHAGTAYIPLDEPDKPGNDAFYRVQMGAFRVKANVESLRDELRNLATMLLSLPQKSKEEV